MNLHLLLKLQLEPETLICKFRNTLSGVLESQSVSQLSVFIVNKFSSITFFSVLENYSIK